MSEQGDFELFSGPAPSEKSEMSDEKFQEEMRRTQQALAQLQQEEGKSRGYDNSLAGIIVQFLSQPQNTDLFLLISRVVAQNIPSNLIIAILSLIDQRAYDETKSFLVTDKGAVKTAETALIIHQKADFHSLIPEQKRAIDNWISNISRVAANKPHRVLETIIINGSKRELSSVVVQLSAFILRKFLAYYKIEIEFQDLRDFMQGVFVEIVKNLEELIKGQKQLK